MKTLSINLSPAYPIYIDQNLLQTDVIKKYCLEYLKSYQSLVIITDSNIADTLGKTLQDNLIQQNLPVELLSFPAGEKYKTRETKQLLEDKLLLKQYGRDTCLIALGGGVTTDMAGFLGATYCRGIPVIYIPTTLLAMVDASVGGKTGVNTPAGKNLIGTFTQPAAVFIDTEVLNTLPQKEWRNGMAEMIKHSLIADADLLDVLQKKINPDFLAEIIYKNCFIKKNIIEQDEHEKNLRQLLNFGHTIGHAIETIEHYRLGHGEAVAIGMLVETYLSIQSGFLDKKIFKQLEEIFQDYGFPLSTCAFEDREIFKKRLVQDKKTVNNIPRFVLLDAIGKPHCDNNQYAVPVDVLLLDQALDWAAEFFRMK